MITIGRFHFPLRSTFVKVRTREVLSRMRREIHLYAVLLRYRTLTALEQDLELLEEELERFDRREISFSIHPGRYFMGWRRDYRRIVDQRHRMASIHLVVLTDDRFERSLEEHDISLAFSPTVQSIQIENRGNGLAYPRFLISAASSLEAPLISDGQRCLSFNGILQSGETLDINSENRTALRNGSVNVLHLFAGVFPRLTPGENLITCQGQEGTSYAGTLQIQFRDLWV